MADKKRDDPDGRLLLAALFLIFWNQRLEAERHVSAVLAGAGSRLDLTRWDSRLTDALTPAVGAVFLAGWREEASRAVANAGRPIYRYADAQKLSEAARRLARESAESINRGTQERVAAVAAAAADAVSQGLSAAEARSRAMAAVDQLLRDEGRALRAAETEEIRAHRAGQYLAARDSGMFDGKEWLTADDPCETCLAIAEQGVVDIDQPFYVDLSRGPHGVIYHPPAHPHCRCRVRYTRRG